MSLSWSLATVGCLVLAMRVRYFLRQECPKVESAPGGKNIPAGPALFAGPVSLRLIPGETQANPKAISNFAFSAP